MSYEMVSKDLKVNLETIKFLATLRNYRLLKVILKAVDKNFDGIRRVVNDVNKFNRRITNPRTWKDSTSSTIYLE